MFDVGFTEILLIGVVSLVVIGPERLPEVARKAGRLINKLQRFVRGVKSDLAAEFEAGELKQLLGDQRKQINELRQIVSSTQRELQKSTSEIVTETTQSLKSLESSLEQSHEAVSADDIARTADPAEAEAEADHDTGVAIPASASGAETASAVGSAGRPAGVGDVIKQREDSSDTLDERCGEIDNSAALNRPARTAAVEPSEPDAADEGTASSVVRRGP